MLNNLRKIFLFNEGLPEAYSVCVNPFCHFPGYFEIILPFFILQTVAVAKIIPVPRPMLHERKTNQQTRLNL